MKSMIVVLVTWLVSCAQTTPGKKDNKDGGQEIFNSKYVKLLPDTTRMMLIENVVIRYGDLYAEADSALLEKPKEMVTVFGIKKASFKGKEIDKKEYKDRIRYKKGEETFYID